MDFKRALLRVVKGTFCKPIRHLLEAKRVCIKITTMENIRQKVRRKQTFIQKSPMLGAFKMSYLVYFVMLLYNSIFVILLSGGQEFGVKIISSHSLQTRMQDYRQQQDVPHMILQPMYHHYILGRKHLLVEE